MIQLRPTYFFLLIVGLYLVKQKKSITVISAALSVMGGDCGFNTGPCSVSKLLSPLSLFFR